MMCDDGPGLPAEAEILNHLARAIDAMIDGVDKWEQSFFMVTQETRSDDYHTPTLTLQWIDTMQCIHGDMNPKIEIHVKKYRPANWFERAFKWHANRESWMPDGEWVLIHEQSSGEEAITRELANKIHYAEKSWMDDKERQIKTKSSQRALAERKHRVALTYYGMDR